MKRVQNKEEEVEHMLIPMQTINQASSQKVIINEQDFEPLQLIIYTTRLKMEGKEIVWQGVNGKQCAV